MRKLYFIFILTIINGTFLFAQTGKSLNFDGTNDLVNVAIPAALSNPATQDFTVEMWVKPESFGTQRVFFAQTSTSNFVNILINASGNVYLYVYNGGTNSFNANSNPITVNTWSHIAVTWAAATETGKVIINGVEATTTSGGSSSTGTSGSMAIGGRPGGAQYFDGTIDEFRIWNVVKSAAEISVSMNVELSLPQTGLESYYKFNQGVANGNNPTVTTLNDELNTNNGTLTNFALNGTTSNWVGDSVLSVKDIRSDALYIVVAPNPTKDIVTIFGLKNESKYQIFDAVGRVVSKGIVSKRNNQIDFRSFNKGLYFVQIGDEKIKVLKE